MRRDRRSAYSDRDDQFLHDLVGAAVDRLHPRVGVHAGDRVLGHVAVAAEQLQALVDHLALLLGAPPLGHRRGRGVQRAGDQRAAMQSLTKHARHVRRGGALGQLEAACSGSSNSVWPKALRSLGVVHRQLHRALDRRRRRHADAARAPRAAGPSAGRSRGPRAAQQVRPPARARRRRTARRCPAPACPILSSTRPRRKPGEPCGLHHEQRHALGSRPAGSVFATTTSRSAMLSRW